MEVSIKIGLAGNTKGMTEEQKSALKMLITKYRQKYKKIEFHHGDCIGTDEQAHLLLLEYSLIDIVEIHPPKDHSFPSFKIKKEIG